MMWLAASIKWIMLVSGLLTCTMLYAAVAPQASLRSTFGEGLEGPVAEIVVRNWGALIGVVGALLVYGAFYTSIRRLALVVATISKVVFVGLVLTFGRQFLAHQVGTAVVIDSVMVLVFACYLLATPSQDPV